MNRCYRFRALEIFLPKSLEIFTSHRVRRIENSRIRYSTREVSIRDRD